MVSNAAAAFHWTVDEILHVRTAGEVLAMTAAHAWGRGCEVAGATYEDRERDRILRRLKAGEDGL